MSEFFISVIIMLVAARVLGEVAQRMKQPALVGELFAGVLIGPSLLGLVHVDTSLKVITDLGVFFLMFLTGLEMHPNEIKKAGKKALLLSTVAFFVPFLAGTGVSHLLGLDLIISLFIGLTLAITAVPVSAVVLMEFNLLKSKLGSTVMTAGVINDILSLVVLAIILQMAANPDQELDYGNIGFSVVKIAAFVGGIFLLDFILGKTKHFLPRAMTPWFEKLKTREASFGILLVSAIGLSLIAEQVGLHFVIGTFFAGLIIYRELIGKENFERVSGIFSAITFGFLAPIFFAFIGIELNIYSITDHLPLFAILLGVAIGGKVGGGFIGAKLAGFSKSESKTIGYLMNNRGMVELVIATIGLEAGLIDVGMFSVIVAVGFITTIMSPIMARSSLRRSQETPS
ncbi:cation:proton antiporter [Candidatus Nitrosotenuis uzonensis]|uniref:Putative Na(+)/H(+) antiporter n=1 Tax=Candidatus Nitrosotenuis uzonensis TaxID=1407055 RepID=A0A812EWL9_9ARCH|nr:cation:proton antiporter [Candidatus Nitrosotenuis uzonensis]CAE6494631.1 putative Na(+)/H(+) antiporter [Candidatus Nitrosotenuis uzonensis]